MNIYRAKFTVICPSNQAPISYDVTISVDRMILVEDLYKAFHEIVEGYHEDIADMLFAKFGGHQTIHAEHHGVSITTERS